MISNSRPNSAAAETISAFFILFKAVLERVLALGLDDSAIAFATSSVAGVDKASSPLDKDSEPSLTSFFSSSLDVSTASDPLNNLEKKPFFFVSLLSLITYSPKCATGYP